MGCPNPHCDDGKERCFNPIHRVFRAYRRTGLSEMRPYILGEDLSGISLTKEDEAREGELTSLGGMIARNPKNHADQWYVSKKYFADNLELVD